MSPARQLCLLRGAGIFSSGVGLASWAVIYRQPPGSSALTIASGPARLGHPIPSHPTPSHLLQRRHPWDTQTHPRPPQPPPGPSPQHPRAVGFSRAVPASLLAPRTPQSGAERAIKPTTALLLRPHGCGELPHRTKPPEKWLSLQERGQRVRDCFRSWRWILPFSVFIVK